MQLLAEIRNGESETLELKRSMPTEDKKYLKTVAAFANGKGGKIVFGIEDETFRVIGVPKEKLFVYLDSITNAIAENCSPSIVPNIFFQAMGQKTVIVLEIQPGQNKPYFIKREGLTDGTYVRIGATTRRATAEKLHELFLYGKRLSFDEMPFGEKPATSADIERLCQAIKRFSKKNVTRKNLESWLLLVPYRDKRFPSNAFELLTNNAFTFAKIQCARFKGREKGIFIDKKDFDGPLYEQIEKAYDFVLSHINLSAKIQGVLRKEEYEIPPEAIREVVINAVVHRNYLVPSFIQIAVYDDRVEVSSPGALFGGITIEEMKTGSSSIRNKVLADVFAKMNIIEHWGSGILKVFSLCREKGLREPSIEERTESLVIALWRKATQKATQKTTRKTTQKATRKISNAEMRILDLVRENAELSRGEIAEKLGNMTPDGVKYHLANLQRKGALKRVGGRKFGSWLVLENKK